MSDPEEKAKDEFEAEDVHEHIGDEVDEEDE